MPAEERGGTYLAVRVVHDRELVLDGAHLTFDALLITSLEKMDCNLNVAEAQCNVKIAAYGLYGFAYDELVGGIVQLDLALSDTLLISARG